MTTKPFEWPDPKTMRPGSVMRNVSAAFNNGAASALEHGIAEIETRLATGSIVEDAGLVAAADILHTILESRPK